MILISALFTCLVSRGQGTRQYFDLLRAAEEVELMDSLHINVTPDIKYKLDSLDVKRWFSPLLGSSTNNRLKNRNYYLTGKITTHPNFDLLVLMEEKKKNDSISGQSVYLITTKKDGTYIASLQAAIAGTRKKSSYNTSSWLFKDYKLVLDSKMVINDKEYDDYTNYKINGTGRFILYPKTE